jgi:hypothetical protein
MQWIYGIGFVAVIIIAIRYMKKVDNQPEENIENTNDSQSIQEDDK